ncbi:MAG TPA: DUF4465 domain-containing protein, partial [Gemmatales bacterium]|nr:DUF4465 domain-containing protein [Gemmatales bacterium]
TVDLSGLGAGTSALTFELTSSDVGPFGMNTPAYFAMDNLVVAVPEPGTMALVGSAALGLIGWYGRRRWWYRATLFGGPSAKLT